MGNGNFRKDDLNFECGSKFLGGKNVFVSCREDWSRKRHILGHIFEKASPSSNQLGNLRLQTLQYLLLLFSRSVMSDSLQLHGLQHARLPCPSPSPGACSNSCPLSQWCHPIILSSVIPFSTCLQSFPASGSFLMSRLLASGGQSIGASSSFFPMNIQDWFPLGFSNIYT